jgi:hypothetical protein
MPKAMKKDVAFDPADMTFFGFDTVMPCSDFIPDLIK